jgi:hypothetical protein
MWRTITAVVLGVAIGSAGLLAVSADDSKTEIKGGIEGKVKRVDVEAKTLTITTTQGRERTFTITDDTTMVGPRGGKVRRRLHDPRFQDGMPLTIVADGTKATEIHLGYDRDSSDTKDSHAQAPARGTDKPGKDADTEPSGKTTKGDQTTKNQPASSPSKTATKSKPAAKVEDADEDNEIPGKVKSFDATRRVLVVTLLNGKDRSFILSRDVKVLVKGAESKHGLEDPALKNGAAIDVVTDEGGRKVKELKIVPASQLKPKKAG